MPVDGETYLRRLIEDRLRMIAEARGDPTSFLPSIALPEVQAAADALAGVGAVAPERAQELFAGFRQTLLDTGVIQEVRASARAESRIAAVAVDEEAAARWRAIAERREPPSEPVRVVSVVREIGRVDETRVIVLSLELWSAGFRIRYATSVPEVRGPDEPPDVPGGLAWEASDDVGTRYRQGGGGASGGRDWIVGDTEFRPAIPPEAQSITLGVRTFDGGDIGRVAVTL